ncbi:MAG: hypothetical protein NVS3B3_00880 [Aquirhabdus sp.]
MRWLQILAFGMLSYFAYHYFSHRAVKHPEGVITAANDPEQSDTSDSEFTYKQYSIKPLKDFKIVARVLSAEHYSTDAGADLVPVDLALGWGQMSDTYVINQLNISQGGRFYHYSYKFPAPIPPNEMVTHSANMHMIPSNDLIEKQLKDVHKGQIVHLTGQLVEAKDLQKNWVWRSSLTREDSGGGACELIWVKSLYVTDL